MKALESLKDFLGIAAVAAAGQIPVGAPWWVHVLIAAGAYAFGKSAKPGIPVYSSLHTPKADARGQVADKEDPK